MHRLKIILISFLCLAFAIPAFAQDDDKGFITRSLENALAGEGRTVEIDGFRGALSRQATVDRITISDDLGVWLEMSELILELNRAALLQGRIEIAELSAQTINLIRSPKAEEASVPAAEASEFSLPDLPVSIDIQQIKADTINLGKSILGEPASFSLNAALSLIDGNGTANIQAQRLDETQGTFEIAAQLLSENKRLTLDIDLSEDEGGIAARLLNIPEHPSVDLKLNGVGPLNDFEAALDLSTDDQERLTGAFTLLGSEDTGETSFEAKIEGDVTALFAPQYRPFFGDQVSLNVAGTRDANNQLDLPTIEILTDSLSLSGAVTLNAEYWPVALNIDGKIADDNGALVLLPISGADTKIRDMTLEIQYNRNVSDRWVGSFDITGFEQAGTSVASMSLGIDGMLDPDALVNKRVEADVVMNVGGVALSDPKLQTALGDAFDGSLSLTYAEGEPVTISDLILNGSDLQINGDIKIDGLESAAQTTFDVNMVAEDLARFSDISGQNLRGRARFDAAGDIDLGGSFRLTLEGHGQNLGTGQEQLDTLLLGDTDFVLRMNRDTSGTVINEITLRNAQLNMDAKGTLTNTTADLNFQAEMKETQKISSSLRGPAKVVGNAKQAGDDWRIDVAATGPFDTQAKVKGIVTGPDARVNFETSIPSIAPLVPGYRGAAALSGTVFKSDGDWQITTELDGPYALDATITGRLTGSAAPDLAINASLPDVGPFVPNINGPLSIQSSIQQRDPETWDVNANLTGPVGTSASVTGSAKTSGDLNISVAGDAPLALANPFIQPRTLTGTASFDLDVNGPPALSSVSGQIALRNGRLTAPSLRFALQDMTSQILLGSSRAEIYLSANVANGGRLTVNGPLGLTGQFPANLRIALLNVVAEDPTLYKTTVNGAIGIDGSLLSNARISGQIDVGETLVSIPNTGISSFGTIPVITHVDAPAPVRQTLARAGLNDSQKEQSTNSQAGFPLDLTINAPRQIFVRGRGLDAELGGSLRITGNTNNIISSGRFELVRGRLDILQKRFNLDEGSIQLQGDFDPFIRFVAETQTSTGTASVVVDGSATNPEVTFESSPEAPQDEVLAQIFFGRDVSQISAFQALQLANAIATLAGRGGEGLVSKLRRGFNLDDLDITTDDDGNASVRAGKYISDNIYTDVTIGTQNDAEVSLNIDLTPNITARGSASNSGDTSLGIFFEKDY